MHNHTSQHGLPADKRARESLYKAFDSNMEKIDRQAISQESKINKQYDAKRARAESRYRDPGLFGICILARNLTSKMEKIEKARDGALDKHKRKVQKKRSAQEEAIAILFAQSWQDRLDRLERLS
ncbi:hypothetical protein CcaCcLH18_11545 [Colletotrichum camelliae]|nr:hypothetical protein CcaCcLH18_11545 [Colletotrichum camelliae]